MISTYSVYILRLYSASSLPTLWKAIPEIQVTQIFGMRKFRYHDNSHKSEYKVQFNSGHGARTDRFLTAFRLDPRIQSY